VSDIDVDGVPEVLIAGGQVVTMNPTRDVWRDGAVAVADDRIVAVGSSAELQARWPQVPVHDASGCVVTPGYVNGHQHFTGDPLVRSCIPDDLKPGESIFSWSVPLHGAHTGDDDELSATLTTLESLQNGVTTTIEAGTVAHPDRVAKGILAAGGRGAIGPWGWDVDGVPYSGTVDEIVDRQRSNLDALPSGGRVEGWVTLVGHNLASDELLVAATELARERGVNMTMHISPTSSDPVAYREAHGRAPVVHFDHLGILGSHLLLGHAVWLDDDEVEAVLAHDVAIAYCPWAYLRLGQGVCHHGRHAEISTRGGRIALGCDATNAGDSIDILRTAALAAGIAKDTSFDRHGTDGSWFGAHEALEWATIGGAAAIGMADRVGSLEPGKLADVVLHDATDPRWAPGGDIALQLVWGTDGRSVRDVFVGGELVLEHGRSTVVDEAALAADAADASWAMLGRAGIELPRRWPLRDA
jgi:5-methylthioadenosine/S-adenosylhomocysteine deaminase